MTLSLHYISSMGYGAIQINAGSLMLKRTNFVAHHSSFFCESSEGEKATWKSLVVHSIDTGFQATFDSCRSLDGSNCRKTTKRVIRSTEKPLCENFQIFFVICSFSIIFSDGDATEVQTHSSLGKTSYHCGFFPTI